MPLLSIDHCPQEKQVGCLAACVQMALAHIGVTTTQRRLNRLLGLTSTGVPWPNIQRLDKLNVAVTVQIGEELELKQCIDSDLPAVIFVRTGELTDYWHADLQHAVLLIGYDETYVYLNDPAFPTAPQKALWGNLMLAMDEFDYTFAIVTSQ